MFKFLKKITAKSLFNRFLYELENVDKENLSIFFMDSRESPYYFEFIFVANRTVHIFIKRSEDGEIEHKSIKIEDKLEDTLQQTMISELKGIIYTLKRQAAVLDSNDLIPLLINLKTHKLDKEQAMVIYKTVLEQRNLFEKNSLPIIHEGNHLWAD